MIKTSMRQIAEWNMPNKTFLVIVQVFFFWNGEYYSSTRGFKTHPQLAEKTSRNYNGGRIQAALQNTKKTQTWCRHIQQATSTARPLPTQLNVTKAYLCITTEHTHKPKTKVSHCCNSNGSDTLPWQNRKTAPHTQNRGKPLRPPNRTNILPNSYRPETKTRQPAAQQTPNPAQKLNKRDTATQVTPNPTQNSTKNQQK